MNKKEVKSKGQKNKPKPISYRLKCAKGGNGLSHYVMYGDVPKDKALL